jgi:hypothetical protein
VIGVAIIVLIAIGGYGGAAALGMLPAPIHFGASTATGDVQRQRTATPTPAKSEAAVHAEATRDARLARSEVKFGPAKGRLDIDADTSHAVTVSAGASLRDPLVDAQFTNPAAGTAGWDYGFVVRHTAKDHEYRIVITSRGEWICERIAGDADVPASRQHGQVVALRTGPGQVNDVQLLIIGDNGLLFVNNTYTATVDLSQAMKRGDVLIGTSFFPEHRSAAQVVSYSGFQVSARGGNPNATPER